MKAQTCRSVVLCGGGVWRDRTPASHVCNFCCDGVCLEEHVNHMAFWVRFFSHNMGVGRESRETESMPNSTFFFVIEKFT